MFELLFCSILTILHTIPVHNQSLAAVFAPSTCTASHGRTASREKAGFETIRTNAASVSGQVAQPCSR